MRIKKEKKKRQVIVLSKQGRDGDNFDGNDSHGDNDLSNGGYEDSYND